MQNFLAIARKHVVLAMGCCVFAGVLGAHAIGWFIPEGGIFLIKDELYLVRNVTTGDLATHEMGGVKTITRAVVGEKLHLDCFEHPQPCDIKKVERIPGGGEKRQLFITISREGMTTEEAWKAWERFQFLLTHPSLPAKTS